MVKISRVCCVAIENWKRNLCLHGLNLNSDQNLIQQKVQEKASLINQWQEILAKDLFAGHSPEKLDDFLLEKVFSCILEGSTNLFKIFPKK